ncbi:topoisomerase I binding, arginine/serine-rich a [Siniperca chuatsi]|uniref:topoisomerase I binding, arginine/serine-rich a n=1 Tax=Siniperca chuatsi TaxID=119488 RepID=UPI001CE11F9D|nr:topoisomerase I binding, arginine/serine-rich a [Siniperca chuatsi]XP_044045044.1 topoisomerase I binding, arginine/serine-rich a [Siniperca chuatsi]
MSAIKIALQQSQKSGKRKTSEAMSAEVSPDSKCPICLDIFNNISYLDLCLHKFCFRCIHEWSKNKAECPLCKQPFNSIYHSIKSEQDFKKYDLQPLDNGSFGTFGGVRFRYRTTLTGVHRQMRGRTSSPPDNGVMFEAATDRPQQPQDRYIRRMMMRLAAKRRAASEGRAVNNVREQEMINFRRELYRQGVRVRSVRDGGRSRDTSAEFFRRNPACLHRLIPWLKRELIVLYGAHGTLVNIVQHIIMSRITRYDMEDGVIQEELRPFLQGRTEHFLHEFTSFAKSPFNMEAYDQHAVYDCPAPSSNEDSSSNSSVIAISEDEDLLVLELDPPGDSMSTLSHSVWDDETPGPSYSTTAEQSRAECLSVLDSDSDSSLEEDTQEIGASPQQMSPHNHTDVTQGEVNSEECLSYDSDDCVIVGFVKPTAERTPELVQLSSNSDESASEDTKEVPLLPQHIRFSSLSPIASQSSDPSDSGRSENVEMDHYHQLDSKERCSSLTSSRHKTSNKSDRKNTDRRFDSNYRSRERRWSKDRDHRRRRRSRSGERRHSSRSPVISHSSVSTLSRERGYSYTSGRDFYSKYDSNYKRRDSDHDYQSYRHYNQKRNDNGMHYTERRSYYYNSCKYSDRHSYSRSRSRSRDSGRRDRRYSRSRTHSSSRSPSTKRRSHHDKPGGKRKYKTRHLEEPSENTLSTSYAEGDSPKLLTKHKKKSKEKHHKKSKERSRKTSRSLSVELVNEENSNERSKRHHKKKKKHKKKSKRRKSNEITEKCSPTVITIDSDSDSFANDCVTQASSTNKDTSIDNTTDDPVDPAPPYSHL